MSSLSIDRRDSLSAASSDVATPPASPAKPLQLLSFSVDDHEYALPIATVQEIGPMLPIDEAADAPAWADGTVTLRSKTIPFVDLRRVLGNTPVLSAEGARIMIVEVQVDDQPQIVGMIVDAVTRVLRVQPETISGDTATLESGELKLIDACAVLQSI